MSTFEFFINTSENIKYIDISILAENRIGTLNHSFLMDSTMLPSQHSTGIIFKIFRNDWRLAVGVVLVYKITK